jgi:K+/H+ antiporter YhaU regulatory subunit KhtT
MDIERAIARTREDNYGIFRDKSKVGGYSLLKDIPDIEIAAVKVGEKSVFAGKTIAETALRKTCGVTMVAIRHGETVTPNPEPSTVINTDDIAYLLGKPEMIAIATDLLLKEIDRS